MPSCIMCPILSVRESFWLLPGNAGFSANAIAPPTRAACYAVQLLRWLVPPVCLAFPAVGHIFHSYVASCSQECWSRPPARVWLPFVWQRLMAFIQTCSLWGYISSPISLPPLI